MAVKDSRMKEVNHMLNYEGKMRLKVAEKVYDY